MSDLGTHVADPERLAALRSTALLDTPAEESFDRLARLAARLLDAPVALVSLVDADRQFFKSCIDLEIEPWKSRRETPLSHSFCKHNRVAGQPLIIEDARSHPLGSDNKAIDDLQVAAYLGFPLATQSGHVIGSFCVLDSKPRTWKAEDVEILRDLAASVMAEVQLRMEVNSRQAVEGERDSLNDLNAQLTAEVEARREAEEHERNLRAQLAQTVEIEAIGRLAGGIAHDLNNLLAPILIYTSVLLDEDGLSVDHSEIIERIQETGLRARDVIHQLLTIGRMQPDEHTVTDLNRVVAAMENLMRHSVMEDITMEMRLTPGVGAVLADQSQLERVLLNLVLNAADAMPEGGELRIETRSAVLDHNDLRSNPNAVPGNYSVLEVHDTGVGMDAETIQQLGQPFFSTKGDAGTGLGLMAVFGVAAQHGGVVHCESTIGTGTTMRVSLPITTATMLDNKVATADGNDSRLPAETIFVAEDDAFVRESTVRVLKSEGFRVLTAVDAEDALRQLEVYDDAVHMLLTDVVMPSMNGRALYEAAVSFRPSLRVLYMSGYNDDIVSHRGGLEPGAHFISKPFLKEELLAQIQKVLAGPFN